MSTSPPQPEPTPKARTEPGRMVKGLVFFVLGLLIVAAAVIFILVSLVAANPIALVPGILVVLIGVAVNFVGLTLIYRAVSNSIPKDKGGPRETL